jgi:hypothetical protein
MLVMSVRPSVRLRSIIGTYAVGQIFVEFDIENFQ